MTGNEIRERTTHDKGFPAGCETRDVVAPDDHLNYIILLKGREVISLRHTKWGDLFFPPYANISWNFMEQRHE